MKLTHGVLGGGGYVVILQEKPIVAALNLHNELCTRASIDSDVVMFRGWSE